MQVRFDLQSKNNTKSQIYMFVSDPMFRPEIKYYTGRRIAPEHWSKKKHAGKGSIFNELNSRLSELEGMARTIFNELEKEKKVNREEFKNRLLILDGKEHKIKNRATDDFWHYWKEYEELSKTRISKITKRTLSEGTLILVAQAGRNLKKFELAYNYKLTPYNINHEFYEKLRSFYIGKGENDLGNTVNSLAQFVKHIKHFAKWLHKRFPDSPLDYQEFEKYESYDEENIQPLYPDEVLKLWNLDLNKIPGLEKSYYIFMNLLSFGLRISDHNFHQFSDFKDFKRIVYGVNIEGKLLSFRNIKSRSACNVPLVDNEIFRPTFMYKKFLDMGEIPRMDGEYLNMDLKIIGEKAGIDRIRITSKTGRKTFATIWLMLGMEIYEVMKMGGWKSEKAFRAYVGIDRSDLFIKSTYIQERENKNKKDENAPKTS